MFDNQDGGQSPIDVGKELDIFIDLAMPARRQEGTAMSRLNMASRLTLFNMLLDINCGLWSRSLANPILVQSSPAKKTVSFIAILLAQLASRKLLRSTRYWQ